MSANLSILLQDIRHSPHNRMHICVEIAWILSTGIGIFLFLIQIGVIAWIRFYRHSHPAAIAVTCVVIPAVLAFIVFSMWFYKNLISHKYKQSEHDIKRIQAVVHQLDSLPTEDSLLPVDHGMTTRRADGDLQMV